jgi:hypothetical protein
MNWEDIIKFRQRDIDAVKRRKQKREEKRKLRSSPSYFLQEVKRLKKLIETLEKTSESMDIDKKKRIANSITLLEKEINKLMGIALDKNDTFEKEAGGVSFGGHGANPELFNIRYGKKRRDKNGKESK